MLIMIAIGCLLMVISTIVHAGCTYATMNGYRVLAERSLKGMSAWMKTWAVAALVLLLFLAALIEVGAWALTYRLLGVIGDIETAVYFSAVTFTTLGYGDVVLKPPARMLASIEAINGILIFGWSTALLVAFIGRLVRSAEHRAEAGGT